MNTPQKIATILLKGGIAPLTEIASGNSPIPRNVPSSPHGIAPPLRRLPPAIPLSPATALSSPHGIAPLAEIASGNSPIPRNVLSSPHGIAPLAEITSGNSPIPRNGRPPGIIFIKTLPATSHSRENKRRFNFAAKIQPPRNAALIHTPPISKPGILKPLRNRKAVYLLLRRAQTNKRLMKLGFRGLLWYIANLLLNTLLFNRYYP